MNINCITYIVFIKREKVTVNLVNIQNNDFKDRTCRKSVSCRIILLFIKNQIVLTYHDETITILIILKLIKVFKLSSLNDVKTLLTCILWI